MRGLLITLAIALALVSVAPGSSAAGSTGVPIVSSSAPVYALQQAQPPQTQPPTQPPTPPQAQPPAPDKKIDITINESRGVGRWYANPVWIAIGAVAAVMILLLLVLAVRGGGGGTTVVKD